VKIKVRCPKCRRLITERRIDEACFHAAECRGDGVWLRDPARARAMIDQFSRPPTSPPTPQDPR
jgi:hypothetical protein